MTLHFAKLMDSKSNQLFVFFKLFLFLWWLKSSYSFVLPSKTNHSPKSNKPWHYPGVDFIKVGRKAQIIEIALSKLGARRKARRTPVKSFSKLEHRARIGRKKFMKWAPVGHRTIEVVEHPSYCSYLCFNIQANPQIIHANPQITFICNQKHIYLLKFALIFFLFSLLSAFLCQKLKKHISTCIRSNAGRNIQRIFTIYLNANS